MARIVIKLGTGILTDTTSGRPSPKQIEALVDAITGLVDAKHEVIMVSSGAVAAGLEGLKLDARPTGDTTLLQACAAVGQTRLMHLYDQLFNERNLGVAQLLLTHGDLDSKSRSSRIRSTIESLLNAGRMVPIINENDSVAVEELRFGDNDKLASEVAAQIGADLFILLTTVPGLLDKSKPKESQIVPLVSDIDAIRHLIVDETGTLSVGGMDSKLEAVSLAVAKGIETVIASGLDPAQLPAIVAGEGTCTRFTPSSIS